MTPRRLEKLLPIYASRVYCVQPADFFVDQAERMVHRVRPGHEGKAHVRENISEKKTAPVKSYPERRLRELPDDPAKPYMRAFVQISHPLLYIFTINL